ANTGPLIPQPALGVLFEPFQRLNGRTASDGFGLGLAIVASITAAHHGTVTAEPRPAGGLTVTVTMPRPAGPGSTRLTPGRAPRPWRPAKPRTCVTRARKPRARSPSVRARRRRPTRLQHPDPLTRPPPRKDCPPGHARSATRHA